MQYSIINRSATVSDFRLDAEAYLPIYLNLETRISKKSYTTFEKECLTFTKGIFDIKADCYLEKGGVPFIRISDLGEILLEEEQIINIPDEENNKNKKTYLKRGDLILSKTAYPAACFVDIDCCNVSQDTIAVKLKKDSLIKSHFLSVFLNTQYGSLQMQRWFTGNVQMHLNLRDSKKIKLPILGSAFQGCIEKVVEDAIQAKKKTKKIYNEAEQVLLSKLNLLNWQPKHQLAFVRNYSDTNEAGRIDAEYFQPKYDEIIKAIKRCSGGYSFIGKEFEQNKSVFNPNAAQTYQYVEIGSINVSTGEIATSEVFGSELPDNAKRVLRKDDVIISKVRTYRGAMAIVEQEGLIGSGAFTVLRENGQINKETLLAFLRSKPLLAWSLKPNTGTSYPVILDNDILNLPIPLFSEETQIKVKQKITESFNLRKQSKHLLECAKRAVEIAIEQNEDAAIQWLQERTIAKMSSESNAC